MDDFSLPPVVAPLRTGLDYEGAGVAASSTGGEIGNTRKRPRSTTPTPSSTTTSARRSAAAAAKQSLYNTADGLTLAAQLQDPQQRVHAIHELLKISSSHEANYALDGDAPLTELANIFFECVDWNLPQLPPNDSPHFRASSAWQHFPTRYTQDWADHCESVFSKRNLLDQSKMRMVESILVILRNLSFVAANLRLLAYSPNIITILAGSLYECTNRTGIDTTVSISANPNNSTLALPALQALVNIAPYLDVTGQKLFCDKLFYTPPVGNLSSGSGSNKDAPPLVPGPEEEYGQALKGHWGFGALSLAKRLDTKEDMIAHIPYDILLQVAQDYLEAVWSIFPGLGRVLTDAKSPRLVIMMAVDLLQEFIQHARVGPAGTSEEEESLSTTTPHSQQHATNTIPGARAIMVNIPEPVLDRLMDLLYVPRLGPDSLDYIDPIHNIVTRVTTLKLLMGYDASVDHDVRDRALEVLVPLLELDSPNLARRLGTMNQGRRPRLRLYDAILPILTTQVGRNEAPLLSAQLLRELAKAPENRMGSAYIQNRLCVLASSNPRVAHLYFNYLYPIDDHDTAETQP
jgi:hypothetical protein